ncbi:DUF6694 family lipoprotein [Escherichia fergusonii]|uniref:DUF6694 family lipoprotein n=1 Tax=Escherichia fergusonii TaxID=564 RepID=UPI00061454C1|nr:DUF6694 family lipoprotein [Escherichia fergusonii]KWW07928.1 hypothetical protein VL22_0200225 [Escherichia fergusonii]
MDEVNDMNIKNSILLVISLLVSACDNAPKFDGTSQESLRYSAEKVFESLSEEKKAELKTAIVDTLGYYDTQAELSNDKSYSSKKMSQVVFNGKTADQVISEAATYREKTEKLIQQYLHEK